MMIPSAVAMRGKYQNLKMPVTIIAGEQDRLVDTAAQSGRLHREVTHSKLRRITNAGHMVHQTATDVVMKGIDEVGQSGEGNLSFSMEAA
jgi:pimeloyl-ACP methyl ester carboxylesterase